MGAELARRGAVVVCGGLGGVMEAACRGAKGAGGTTLGILPGETAPPPTSGWTWRWPRASGEARNALVVRASDALVAVGGGYGTLSEVALALKTRRPVIGLDTWDIPGVVGVASPEDAAGAALEAVSG